LVTVAEILVELRLADPRRVAAEQMDRWAESFDN
jgi:hypothetical protein